MPPFVLLSKVPSSPRALPLLILATIRRHAAAAATRRAITPADYAIAAAIRLHLEYSDIRE